MPSIFFCSASILPLSRVLINHSRIYFIFPKALFYAKIQLIRMLYYRNIISLGGESLKLHTFLIIFTVSILSWFFLYQGYLLRTPRYTPSVQAVDLNLLLEQSSFSEADYALLFEQTGLTQPIIDELSSSSDFKERILRFQENYLKEVSVYSEYLPPLTTSEIVGDSETHISEKAFEFAPYHNGYLFFTKSTFTMNWRHGHVGLVTDEIRGITLEALNPGAPTMEQDVTKWQYYPTFKMMRLKNVSQAELNEIADFANTYTV